MTVREHATIRLAARVYRYAGRREADALHELGYSPARYAQVVNALLDRVDVEARYPMEVRRLRRVRERRAAARRVLVHT